MSQHVVVPNVQTLFVHLTHVLPSFCQTDVFYCPHSHYLVKEMLNKIKMPPFTLLLSSSPLHSVLSCTSFPPTCHLPILPPLLVSHTLPSVFTSCVPFLRGACLSSARLCATDSLTITLEEIPRVACQSQLAANPNWVERSIFCINHGIWL